MFNYTGSKGYLMALMQYKKPRLAVVAQARRRNAVTIFQMFNYTGSKGYLMALMQYKKPRLAVVAQARHLH